MLDIELTILFSLPLFIFGWIYFKRRLLSGTTLGHIVQASLGISFYMAVVFTSVSTFTAWALSSQLPGYEKIIFKNIALEDMVISFAMSILITFVSFAVAFLVGGLLYYQKSGRRQPSTKQQA